jgi:uncharacterized repeat protein (TIGR01451 family)
VPPTPAPTEVPRERRSQPTPTVILPTAVPAEPLVPQVRIEKSVSPASVKAGETATFTLRVMNYGDAPASDVVVRDELDGQLAVLDLRSSKGDIVLDGQVVTAYPRTLAPGEEQRYEIVVRVNKETSASQIENIGIVTLNPPDEPGDNITTTTLQILPPARTTQTIPPSLPRTADPTALSVWAQYWPLLALAFGLVAFAVATRQGAFRQQSMRVMVGQAPVLNQATPEECTEWEGQGMAIQLNPTDLVARWQAGTNTSALVALVQQANPQADRLRVSIAVQKVLQAHLKKD